MENNRKRTPEVVDLLWDSSDDETPPAKKPAAKKPKQASLSENTKKNSNLAKGSRIAASKNPSSSSQGLSSWQVATYNIWFGPPTGPLHPDDRMMALSQCLMEKHTSENPLLFIGLQEVTPILLATLKPVLESAGYKVFCQDVSGGGYGVALAVLQTGGLKIIQYGWQPYRSTIMNRGFLYVRAQLPNSSKQILFTTTHLESFVRVGLNGQPYTGAPEREEQIKELERFIQNHMNRYSDLAVAMISGDLNWDDERIQSKGVDKALTDVLNNKTWKDPWFVVREKRRQAVADRNGKVKKKDEPTCYTYDGKESPMLGGNLRRRFDRIVFRELNGLKIEVNDLDLIGKDPIAGLTWTKESSWNGRVTRKVVPVLPSDHFGLVLSLNASGL